MEEHDKASRMEDTAGTGALKEPKPWRYDLIPPEVEKSLAIHYGRGIAAGYGARNWEKGQLFSTYYMSARSHLGEFWAGEDWDSDISGSVRMPDGSINYAHHLDAAIWQLVCLRSHTLNYQLVVDNNLDDRPER